MADVVMPAARKDRRISKPGKGRRRSGESKWVPYLFLAPWLIGIVTITLGPMIASLYLSMTNYDLIGSSSFIGFDNYRNMFHDDRFLTAAWVTARYVIISV